MTKFGSARCDEGWRPAGRVCAAERGNPDGLHPSSHRASNFYHVSSFFGAFNVRHYRHFSNWDAGGCGGRSRAERSPQRGHVSNFFYISWLVYPALLAGCLCWAAYRWCSTGRRSGASTRGLGWVWRCLSAPVLVA